MLMESQKQHVEHIYKLEQFLSARSKEELEEILAFWEKIKAEWERMRDEFWNNYSSEEFSQLILLFQLLCH